MQSYQLSLASAALVLLPVASFGCSVFAPGAAISELLDFNERVSTKADCSFENAGKDDRLSGSAVQDLGGGFVSQKVYAANAGSCNSGGQESISFTDCSSNQSATLLGVGESHSRSGENVVVLTGDNRTVDNALAAMGQVRLVRGDNFARLRQQGSSNRVTVLDGIDAYDATAPEWDRIDPTCGCKLYYPDTAGASQ